MKRCVLVIVAIFGMVTLLYGLSFANEEHDQADIKLLRNAAAALLKSRPDLAAGLSNYADKEAKELEKAEKEEVGEKVEPKEEQTEVSQPKDEKEEAGEKTEPKSEQQENTKY